MHKSLPPVLLAAMALELGGAETHVISLAHELRRRGHTVVVASAGGRLVPLLTKVGIPHVQVPMGSRNPLHILKGYWRLRRVLTDFRIGLVHAHARIPAWIASLAVSDRRIPLVTTYHGVYSAAFPWRYLTAFGRRTIAVSEDVRRHLIDSLGAQDPQIRVVPNGFDTKIFHPEIDIAPLLMEFGVEAKGPHIVNVGRLDNALADVPITLMAALPEIEKRLPGVRLWVLGDGNRGREIERHTEEINRLMGRRVVIATGVRLDVPRFFNLADCIVAVARSAVEGMACGRPVIIAGEGGYQGILTPELIEEFASANFTARGGGRKLDASEMAADIITLLRPEMVQERKRMGEAGRQYVVDHLSIGAITDRILDLYAEVL